MTLAELNILVVDDVNSMRIQIRELLKTFGFRKVKVAAGPEEAIQALELEKFNLLLTDWHMAPFDGLELLKYIRKNPDLAEMGVVMITAESTRERVLEAIQSGVDDYLLKPLTMEKIKTKVFAVLQKRKLLT